MPGIGNSIPVPGDYDGSGHVELAVYIPSQGAFFYRPYHGGPDVKVPFGTPNAGELPVVGDYDGSGRAEVAIYDPSRGAIVYRPASGSPDVTAFLGTANSGTIPVAAPSGSLPEFAGSGSGFGIKAASFSPGLTTSTSTSASTTGAAPNRSSTLPSGPRGFSASARVVRMPVNQAIPTPSKLSS